MAEEPSSPLRGDLAGSYPEFWRENSGGGWATALVLFFLLFWQLLRAISRRRVPVPVVASKSTLHTPNKNSTTGISEIVSDMDLRELINNLEGRFNDEDRWEDVIDKRNDLMSYNAKCCRPKDGPLKYLSITTFEKCTPELLRDFYLDNEYRKEWDKTLVWHEQLEVDKTSGTEIGRTIKKFPLLTPREYVLVWRVWEGKDKTFYCFIKECEHPLAPRQKKNVRVGFFRSGWRIKKVLGRDACEIKMVHQEDAGLNVEMARLAFARGIWSFVCKMNGALREYSSHSRIQSTLGVTSLRLVQVPPGLESDIGTTSSGSSESSSSSVVVRQAGGDIAEKNLLKKPSKKWIAKGLLLVGGIVCLSRGHAALGTQLAMACILKKLMKHGEASNQAEPARLMRRRRAHRHIN